MRSPWSIPTVTSLKTCLVGYSRAIPSAPKRCADTASFHHTRKIEAAGLIFVHSALANYYAGFYFCVIRSPCRILVPLRAQRSIGDNDICIIVAQGPDVVRMRTGVDYYRIKLRQRHRHVECSLVE